MEDEGVRGRSRGKTKGEEEEGGSGLRSSAAGGWRLGLAAAKREEEKGIEVEGRGGREGRG